MYTLNILCNIPSGTHCYQKCFDIATFNLSVFICFYPYFLSQPLVTGKTSSGHRQILNYACVRAKHVYPSTLAPAMSVTRGEGKSKSYKSVDLIFTNTKRK